MGTRITVMRDGILQQCDTPQTLYSRPANIFVAGFIGSPAMNFFDVTVTGNREDLTLDGGSFKIKIPGNLLDSIEPYTGKQVVLGVRPEDIHDAHFAPPGIHPASIMAKVDVTELMGNEVYLYLISGEKNFIARVDPRTAARVGQQVEVLWSKVVVQLKENHSQFLLKLDDAVTILFG